MLVFCLDYKVDSLSFVFCIYEAVELTRSILFRLCGLSEKI